MMTSVLSTVPCKIVILLSVMSFSLGLCYVAMASPSEVFVQQIDVAHNAQSIIEEKMLSQKLATKSRLRTLHMLMERNKYSGWGTRDTLQQAGRMEALWVRMALEDLSHLDQLSEEYKAVTAAIAKNS